ncbi:MAG: efflux transporter outer membrane subunit [Sulfuricella sp.]|nr:efflux transporter outer membrane subunit [Sulfuricella sp.]
MRRVTTLIVLAIPALAACTVGPDYVRPSVEAPAAYKEAGSWKAAEPADHLARGKWWEIFGDPQLDALEEQVNISNQTVRLAEAQFRQARALAQGARAAYYPTVNGDVSVTRSGGAGSARRGGTTAGSSGTATDYNLALDAAWEADVWGRVRRSVESGDANSQASAADLESARLSAQAELAQDYFQLRTTDAQQRLLDATVAAYGKSLALTKNRYAQGVAARADIAQAEAQLKTTQAQAIDLGVQRAQLEHAIALLVGKAPADFSLAPADMAAKFPEIPTGLPSELLERRPDIAAAERRVAAASAQIGIAKSAFFPSLTLSATGGYQSAALAGWLSAPNRFWSLGPALAQTIFDGGLRRAQTDQAIAAYDASVATYRQTVLGGFLQVEDNLAALRILEREAAMQDEAVRAARQSVTLTVNQYRAGIVSYLNVVTVQAAALANERTAADILGRRLAVGVLLVKAIGGGWSERL